MTDKNIMVVLGADISGFKTAMNTVKSNMGGTTNDINKSFRSLEGTVKNSIGGIKSSLGGIAKLVAGAFALDKIKDFGGAILNAAAEADVVEAQFSNAFANVSGNGIDDLKKLAETYNILPERLKPAMAQVQSYFMGSGASAEEAADQTEKAMNIAANGAAYYDKTLEDTTSSLKSFLMGK